MPGKRANLYTTRTSMFSHALSYYKYTQVNTMMYDLRCNAVGALPIKVRNELGTRPWTEHQLKCTCA